MKKTLKTIGIVGAIIIAMFIGYFYGTVQKVIDGEFIDMKSEAFYNNYLDMRTVIGYSGTADGLELYTADGNGYFLEVSPFE